MPHFWYSVSMRLMIFVGQTMGKQGKQRKSGSLCVGVIGMVLSAGVSATTASTTTLTATIMASSCAGEILIPKLTGQAAGDAGTVDFGVINTKNHRAPTRQFSLRLSEMMTGKTGCSAFEVYGRQYPVATLSFEDVGQAKLDDAGVILRYDDGTDTRMRVRVSPLNAEAIFPSFEAPGYVTATHARVNYPIKFAAQGLFDFQAALSQWQEVKSGRFSGSLTVTVVYR